MVFSMVAAHVAVAAPSTPDFVASVRSTNPIAYFRLAATTGHSETGASRYSAAGGVQSLDSGAPIVGSDSHYALLNGQDGYINTTQSGGVASVGSMMAWVKLAALPSVQGHVFYVAGESANGNDFDLQFEQDDALKFYTAAGSHLTYAPDKASLVGQWHMIVATMNTVTHARAIYWDGRLVASDMEGGRPGKTSQFSIGASKLWGGRFLHGGIEDVALWNTALGANQIAMMYAATHPSSSTGPSPAPSSTSAPHSSAGQSAPGAIDISDTAVEIEDAHGKIPLKRDEQIAEMFMTAFDDMERNCELSLQAACSLDQLVKGQQPAIGRLKYNPNLADPNYQYTLTATGKSWVAKANPRHPGLGGFYYTSQGFIAQAYYNPAGPAGSGGGDRELTGRSVVGNSFVAH
jgi:hypothetical protein